MLRKFSYSSVFLGIFLILGVFVLPQNLNAALVSPPYLDKPLKPGDKYNGSFVIYFTEQDPEVLYLAMAKMEINDVNGTKRAVFIPRSEPALANWTTLAVNSIRKPAGVKYENGDNGVTVNYSIDIPWDATPGGNYAVAVISNRPLDPNIPTEEGEVNSALGVGADVTYQIISNIDGELEYNTNLEDFRAVDYRTGQTTWIFPHLPVMFEAVFQNNGNIHTIPRGNIEIFQGDKIANVVLNPNQLRAFPGKSRVYSNYWSEEEFEKLESQIEMDEVIASLPDTFFEHVLYEITHFRIGQYTAVLQGFPSSSQSSFSSEVTIWVFPWHLILTIIVIILAIYAVWRVRKKYRGAEYVSRSSSKYKKAKKAK